MSESPPDQPATPPNPADRPLTRRERRFVAEYLIDLNGAEAIKRIGFKGASPRRKAYHWRQRPWVAAAITRALEQREARTRITQDRVLEELGRVAFSDVRKLFDANGNLRPITELSRKEAASLASIEVEELFQGRGEAREKVGRLHKVKRADKVRALELLGKHLKMFAERHEHTGANGGPIKHEEVKSDPDSMTDAELEALARRGRPAPAEPEKGPN